jgi:hypothetical protein
VKNCLAPEEGGKATMKVCTNCYTENASDEVFCSNCGMSLRAAPTGEEATKLLEEAAKFEEERQRRREQPLTASGIVYLFGHRLTSTSVSYGLRDHHATPVQLPLSDEWVWAADIGMKLWEAAFVSLAQDGYVDLQVERRESSVLAPLEVAINQVKSADDLPRSLERSIMEALDRPPQTRWLKDAVRRLTKRRGNWAEVVYITRDALVEMGWLQRGVADKKFVHGIPTEEAVPLLDAMAGEVETVVARVMAFEDENPELYERLLRDTYDGITARFPPSWLL